jgi:hypothetical protein
MVDEMELVAGLKDAAPLRDAAFEEAREQLRETMGRPRPVGRKRRAWAIWSTAGLGIAASAVAVTLVIGPVAQLKAIARAKHAKIPIPVHPPTAAQRAATMDNEIWENSLDALQAGAGQPEVRAGVLRLLSTLPEVTVHSADVNGAAMLTLTATAPAMPANYQETLTINGTTGVPVNFAGGVPGHRPDTTSTYRVSRVTVAAIAAGK